MGEIASVPARLAILPGQLTATSPDASRIAVSGVLVALDCDLTTGAKIGGGTATDNATAINLTLAAATAAAPVNLKLDGPTIVGSSLTIPTTGNVVIEGNGWGTGIFAKSGSNCCPIRTANVGSTNLAIYNSVHPSAPQSITGKNVRLSNFFVNLNRGSYPNGLVGSNANDTTLSGAGTPDARGLPSKFFYTGLNLCGIENLVLEKLWVYDSPSYHIDLYCCKKVRITDCRIEAADPNTHGNTDGIHVNGNCDDVQISRCWIATGDDPIAWNVAEGDGQGGSNLSADDIIYANCTTGGRVLAGGSTCRRVSMTNIRGSVQWWGFQVGNENSASPSTESTLDLILKGWRVNVTNPTNGGGLLYLTWNVGDVVMDDCHVVGPAAAHSLVKMGSGSTAPVVSSLTLRGLEVHRTGGGSQAVNLLTATSGTIANLKIDGFRVTDYGSYTAIPYLINLSGSAAITRLWVASCDMNHVTTFCNDYTKIGSIAGPGCSGLALPDSVMADGWAYLAADHSNLPYIKVGGTARPIALASVGSLAPGTATAGAVTNTTAAATATDATGGTSPYTYQWYRSTTLGSLGSTVSGQTTRTLSDTGLSSGTTYYYTLRYTDATSAVVYSNQVTEITTSAGGGANAAHAVDFELSSNAGKGQPLGRASATGFNASGGSFTVGCFVKFESLPASLQIMISKYDGSNNAYALYLSNSGSRFNWQVTHSGGTTPIAGGTTVTAGAWYFVAGVYDHGAGASALYVNAVQDATPIATGPPLDTSSAFWIGGSEGNLDWDVDGLQAMTFGYKSALSGTLLTWLYNGGLGRSTADILAHAGLETPAFLYGFDDSADLGHDSGPNSLHLASIRTTPPVQGVGPG